MNRYTQGSLPVDCGHWGFNGFSVSLSGPVLWSPHSIMRRIVTLVNQVALATTDSAGLQAQMVGANQAATRYQAENLQLKQVWSIPEISLQTKPQIMVLHRSHCIPASFRSMDFLSIRCWATPEPILSKISRWNPSIYLLATLAFLFYQSTLWHLSHSQIYTLN